MMAEREQMLEFFAYETIGGVIRIEGHADTGCHMNAMALDKKGLRHRDADLFRHGERILNLANRGQQQHELIATEPSQGIGGAQFLAQPLGQGLQ